MSICKLIIVNQNQVNIKDKELRKIEFRNKLKANN